MKPGGSGQKFQPEALERIKFLREGAPDVKIEVDGGINKETAALAREAGADIAATTSFIFESPDRREAYRELKEI